MRLTISRFRFACGVLVCFSFVVATNAELKAQKKASSAQKQTSDEPVPQLPSPKLDNGFVTTAEQFLERIVSPDPSVRFKVSVASLSEEELGKVAEMLRERYPIVSLRERLGRYATASKGETNKPDVELRDTAFGILLADSIRTVTLKKDWNKSVYLDYRAESSRTAALKKLHSDKVNDFIKSPGFGVGRKIQPASPYDLQEKRRYAVRLNTQPVDSDLRHESPVELPTETTLKPDADSIEFIKARFLFSQNGMPTIEMANRFHERNSGGFGLASGWVESVDEVAGFKAHRARFDKDWSQSITLRKEFEMFFGNLGDPPKVDWKLNRMQLVSLLLNDGPQVYLSDNLPDMEELSGADVETRGLDLFETDALKKLRGGHDVITRATPNRLQMVGAMRATQECMQCHAVKKNELLGAFSYEFLRDPKLDLKEKQF